MSNDERKRWRFTYQPPLNNGGLREFVFEGTVEQRDAFFLEQIVCKHCKEEMQGTWCTVFEMGKDGYMELEEKIWQEPYTDPMQTPCSYEWDWVEIA